MRSSPRIFSLLILACSFGVIPVLAQSPSPAFAVGEKIETLAVGPTTYRQVQVRSVNVHTLVILHAGGLASIRLRDLSPQWQAHFHYNAAADAAADAVAVPTPAPVIRAPKPVAAAGKSKYEQLLQKFGQPAEIRKEVDLRPQFFDYELAVKSQGRRPSCAIFAIVSALEFQNAELVGHAEKFSEEYLIWAVRKTVHSLPSPDSGAPNAATLAEDSDEGFSLPEVVAALRAYGIPLQSSMPNTFGSKIAAIAEPPPDIITQAREHQRVFIEPLPGRDTGTALNNIVHALNAGVPVPIGLDWPNYRALRGGYLDRQKPMTGIGHAVTLVGYQSAGGRLEDTVFIFKNSWGPDWGQGGYGTVTYAYLSKYLREAILLEVQAGKAS